MTRKTFSLPVASLAAALLASTLAGCAPLVIGGAAAGAAIMMNDRRSSGAQIDDETIEMRAGSRLTEAFGERAHVNVASYNRQVLLTGEVPSEAAKQQAEQIVSRVDTVRSVVNELAVMPPTSLTQRSSDVFVTGKVRASFVDAADLQAQAFRVVTERGTVYLMGRVTPREAERGTNIARQIPGVQRVVRIFEIMSPEELRQAGVSVPGGSTAAPATVAPTPAPAPARPVDPASEIPPAGGGAIATPVR
ncbi:BON domain-containing protein [Ramlibacter sp. USB13]|uniref:BON domain-containing protein n=1 Tax=Ramlibacter cellulosilyticus TaxID=2764187 RepID=A0A923SBK7_9BURK|nr:BON domain-containing protein [Ramlibacter cellulosilyticus]MBC5784001.1 BON domain-containing protein [Ramlibacter cellulosilyticus]